MTQLSRGVGVPLLLAAVLVAVGFLLFTSRGLATRRATPGGRRVTAALAVLYVMVLGLLVLRPVPGLPRAVAWPPGLDTLGMLRSPASGEVPLVQLAGNVMLFVPLGWLLPELFPVLRSSGRTPGAAATISLVVEAAQWLLNTGRVASLDDAVFNVIGAAVGYGWWRMTSVEPVARPS